MNSTNTPGGENYRFSSLGTIKVYGNSVEIEEHTDHITKDILRKIVQRETELAEHVNDKFDEAFRNHVLRYGQEFEEHDFWFNGVNYYPQHEEEDSSKVDEVLETPKRERGDITGFSQKSRYRMQKKMNRLNPDALGTTYSMTLTYPKRFTRRWCNSQNRFRCFYQAP